MAITPITETERDQWAKAKAVKQAALQAVAPGGNDSDGFAGDPLKNLPPLAKRSVAQVKNYNSFLGQFGQFAPLSTAGAFAVAVSAVKQLLEKEGPADVLPPLAPSKATQAKDSVTEMPGDATETSNEPSIDGDRKNPSSLVWAYNDYDLQFGDINPGIHGQLFYTSAAFGATPPDRHSLEVKVNEPDKYSGPDGGQGDFIIRVDPKNPNNVYALFMAFSFNDQSLNSVQLQTFKDGGATPLNTFTILKHTDAEGTADFEDKCNMAVDPSTGTVMVTNTRFFADGSGSQINAYFLKPKLDAQGNPTGDFDFVNPKDAAGNPTPVKFSSSSNQVQWSQPGFMPGSKPIIAYRDFTDDNIYAAVAPGIAATPSAAVSVAKIGADVGNYFGGKFNGTFNTQFRALSAPQIAVNTSNGNAYIVYDDAQSGKSLTYFVKSTDGGKTWSKPLAIGSHAQGANGKPVDHWMSDVDVDPQSGVIGVGFLGIDDKGDYNAYVMYSKDGGNNWEHAQKVSQETSNFMRDGFSGQFSGDYTKVLARSATANGKTSLVFDYAHPTAYLFSDPKVRVDRLSVDPQISLAQMRAMQAGRGSSPAEESVAASG